VDTAACLRSHGRLVSSDADSRWSEGSSRRPVKDLEVSAVVEYATATAGEDAPVRAGREVLEVLAEQHDQFRMEERGPRFAGRPVLEFAALPG
jgi:hypothetical protein